MTEALLLQRLKAVDRSSDLSETLSEHAPTGHASGEMPGKLHASELAHSGSTSLTHSQSGEGSSRLDDVDDVLDASAEAATHSAGANMLSRDVTLSTKRGTELGEGVTHDSGIASSSRRSEEREASKELADAMLLASVAASPMPAKANQQPCMPNTGQSLPCHRVDHLQVGLWVIVHVCHAWNLVPVAHGQQVEWLTGCLQAAVDCLELH